MSQKITKAKMLDLSIKDQIGIVLPSAGSPDDEFFIIFRGNCNKSFGTIDQEWAIDTRPNRYSSDNQTDLSKEEFIDFVSSNYPEDFQWMLFHPEIFEGYYYE